MNDRKFVRMQEKGQVTIPIEMLDKGIPWLAFPNLSKKAEA
jgi:hypothetical protein